MQWPSEHFCLVQSFHFVRWLIVTRSLYALQSSFLSGILDACNRGRRQRRHYFYGAVPCNAVLKLYKICGGCFSFFLLFFRTSLQATGRYAHSQHLKETKCYQKISFQTCCITNVSIPPKANSNMAGISLGRQYISHSFPSEMLCQNMWGRRQREHHFSSALALIAHMPFTRPSLGTERYFLKT